MASFCSPAAAAGEQRCMKLNEACRDNVKTWG
jgi:hypothetical protein